MAVKFKYLVCLAGFLIACEERQEKQLARAVDESLKDGKKITKIEWIEGNYENQSNSGVYREYWKKNKEGEYIGRGYFLHKGDTSFLIRMKLFIEDGVVKMDYNVKGQNEGKDVQFALTKHEDNLYVFENPFRDFPSILQYKFMGDTAINIVERGFENNETKEQDFIIKKIP